jgi:Zn-dependent protease
MFDLGAMLLLFIFAVLFAMGFNYGGPRFMNYAVSKPWGQRLNGSYAGKTVLTAIMVFALLVGVSLVMSAVKEKPALPSV